MAFNSTEELQKINNVLHGALGQLQKKLIDDHNKYSEKVEALQSYIITYIYSQNIYKNIYVICVRFCVNFIKY